LNKEFEKRDFVHIDLSETNKDIREMPIPSALAFKEVIDAYIASKNSKVISREVAGIIPG
jgi:hypothetical protein